MKKIMALTNRLYKEESGQGMVEYALIIALIAVALIAILTSLNGGIKATFQDIIDKLSPATP
jgi:pilus assembly protein Flp/PilA